MSHAYGGGLPVRQERALIRKAQQGTTAKARTALNQLVKEFRRLVISEANSFIDAPSHGALKDDLIQEGLIGLLEAAQRFDLSRGTRFSTFATPTVRGRMLKYLRSDKPHRKCLSLSAIPRRRGHEELTPAELIRDREEAPSSLQRSLDRIRRIGRVQDALETLTDRQREVVRLRYWHNMPQVAIADRLKLSRARVSTLLKTAHERLEPLLQGM